MANEENCTKEPAPAVSPRPVHVAKLGKLRATVFANQGARGEWYSVALSRVYKSNGVWGRSNSLGRDDLLAAGLLLQDAYRWIVARETARLAISDEAEA